MDPSQANSPEDQRQLIDAEIKLLEQSILELKYRRNALAPVSSLPTEIFTIIFSYLRLPGSSPAATPAVSSLLPNKAIADLFFSSRLPGAPPLGRLPDHPLSWLHAAQVCHQWREIALRAHVAQLVVTLVRIGCKLLYKIGKAHVDPFRKVTIVNVWTQ